MRNSLLLLSCLMSLLLGCASLPATPVEAPSQPNAQGFHYLESVVPVAQTAYQCGPAALESVIRHWGKEADAEQIGRSLSDSGTRGVLNFSLARYARDQGFWTEIRQGEREDLRQWIQSGIPPVVMLRVGPLGIPIYHFIVLKGFNDEEQIFYANTGHPATRAIRYAPFFKRWDQADDWTLLICPPEKVNWKLSGEQSTDLGLLLERAGRLGLAESWYQTALAKDSMNQSARFNLANLYSKTNRVSQAKAIYQELFKEKPGWAPASNNLAWICLEEGNPQEAVRVIETALQAGAERRFDMMDTLGVAYCRLKQYDKAQEYFREALGKMPPENLEILRMIRAHRDECKEI